MEMTYTKAIEMYMAGDNRGYEYLYYSTYNVNKWDIAKILGNEFDAEDVLQNAYIKMIDKLHMLDDPEKFPAWFNRMATNMAIDVWRSQHIKKKGDDSDDNYRRLVSFSEFEQVDGDGEVVEYEWEDESIAFRPEETYSQKETVDMVHQMLNNLPEEQKTCLVMFHLQGHSIKEIAEDMQVSENTIKSRLNYARKNIEAQGEELKKKGYQLYSAAPLPLLLYLLRMQRGSAVAADAYWGATTVSSWAVGTAQGAVEIASQGAIEVAGQSSVGIAGQGAVEAVSQSSVGIAGQGAVEVAGKSPVGIAGQSPVGIAGQEAFEVAGQGVVEVAGNSPVGIAGQGAAEAAGQVVAKASASGAAQAVVGTGAKAAAGFFGTLGGKIALAVGSAVLIAGGAVAINHFQKEKDDSKTTEQVIETTEEIAEITETTELTTEASIEEVVDERTLLATYYQDTLVPQYGVVPEFQANTQGEACIAGIFCSDIDDYDQDGVLDLYVMYNELTEVIEGDEYSIGGRNYNKHQVLYTVEEGQVVQKSDLIEESALVSLSVPEGYSVTNINDIVILFRENRKMWKISVDGKIYLFEYMTGGEWRGSYHKVYTYGTDNLELVKSADSVNQGEDAGYYSFYDYENGQIVAEYKLKDAYVQYEGYEHKTMEEFYGELGLSVLCKYNDIYSFENEKLVMYDMYSGSRPAGYDVSLVFNGVSETVESTDMVTEDDSYERELLEAYFQDTLVAQYGLVPEYNNESLENAILDGIYCSDIDDYNGDGVLELFVCRYHNKNNYTPGVNTGTRIYGEYKEVYSVRDGQVILIDSCEREVGYALDVPFVGGSNTIWKVKVDNKVYLVNYTMSPSSRDMGRKFFIYEYQDSRLRIVRQLESGLGVDEDCFYWGEVYIDGVSQGRRQLYGPENGIGYFLPEEYADAENITEEEFMAEMGIICNIDNAAAWDIEGIITYQHENELLCKVIQGVQGGNNAVVTYKNILTE